MSASGGLAHRLARKGDLDVLGDLMALSIEERFRRMAKAL